MINEKLMGIILNNPELWESIKIHGNIFTGDCHKLYEMIEMLAKKNGAFNKDSIVHFITDDKHFSLNRFYEIYESDWKKEHFKTYLNEILTQRLKDKLKVYSHEVYSNDYKSIVDIKCDIQDFIDNVKLEEEIEIKDGKDACIRMVENLKEGRELKKVSSCIRNIDEHQSGYDLTDYVIIGAGESVGKTSYAINNIVQQLRKGLSVGVFSCEMSRDKIYGLLACNISGIDSLRWDNNILTEVEKTKFIKAVEALYEKPLYIIDRIRNWNDIQRQTKIMKKKFNIDIVYIDYLQYVWVDKVRSQYERLEIISKGIKQNCRDLMIPHVAIAQLNREGKKADRRPYSGDIKGNGDIEYDADIIILLDTESEAIEGDKNKRKVKFYMTKNRNGKRLDYTMTFDCPSRRFKEQTDYFEAVK